MFTSSARTPSQTYSKIGIETGVMSANPHQLILMLLEGALMSVGTAMQAMRDGRIAEKGQAVSKAIDIVGNGLRACLDFEAGGEISLKLAALYDYINDRLLHANLRNDPAALEEVSHLLREIKGAWEEIASDPAVVSFSKKIA